MLIIIVMSRGRTNKHTMYLVRSVDLRAMQEVARLLRSAPVSPDSKVAVEKYLQIHAPELL